jgi:hypothetical protein
MNKLVCLAIVVSIIAVVILGDVPKASATNIEFKRVISKWNIGAPWEPMKFGVNITDSEIDVLNVTLFYALNTKDPRSFVKVQMKLESEGDLRNGFWSYTFSGQPNSTIVYYAYAVYYVDGSYQGPEPSLDAPYEWRISSPPQSVLRLHSLQIRNVDPIELTVDIDCDFYITWNTDQEAVWLQVTNKIDDYYYSEQRNDIYIPHAASRYEYRGQVTIEDLKLTNDPSPFPFDNYFLELEFGLFDCVNCDTVQCDIKQIELPTPFNYVWNFRHNTPQVTNETITTKFYFERRPQNALNIILPLYVCWFSLGASLMIDHEKLRTRLAIYIALFVFLLNFTGYIRSFVPTKALGISFAEMAFLYLSLYMGIYFVLSVVGNYFANHYKTMKDADNKEEKWRHLRRKWGLLILDFLAFFVSVLFAFFWPVIQSDTTSKTLMDLIPDYRVKLVFLIALSYGLLPSICSSLLSALKLDS